MTLGPPEPFAFAPRMVDLFAGPGGLDLAALWLGVPVSGIEWDDNACATRRNAGLSTVQGDVRDYGPGDFPGATILAGGPPCQTYTVAGTGAGRRSLEQVLAFVDRMSTGEDVTEALAALDDERTGLVLEPLRWALDAHRMGRAYELIMLEQVPAVLPVWKAMAKALEKIGYQTAVGVLRAEEFGVPQTRMRAILVARLSCRPTLPDPTHRRFRKMQVASEGQSQLLPCVTLGDALDRSEPFVVVSNYGSGGNPKARGRRTSDEPSFTVTGKVLRNRVLSFTGNDLGRFRPSEAGQLQTFPADYPWSGKDVAQQIGNAIPPRLATHVLATALGRQLAADFFDGPMESTWNAADEGASRRHGRTRQGSAEMLCCPS